MPPPRTLILLLLLVLMEVLAGFGLAVASSLLDATSLGLGLLWLLLASAIMGVLVGIGVALLAPRSPWDRILLLLGALPAAVLPAALTSRAIVPLLASLLLLTVAYWRGLVVTQEPPILVEVQYRFGLGFVLLFLGLLAVFARGAADQRDVWLPLTFIGVAFTAAAMVALVVSRVAHAREPGAGIAVALAVAIQIGVLLGLALLLLQIFTLNLAGEAWTAIAPLRDAAGGAVYRIVLALANPLDDLISSIRFGGFHFTLPHLTPLKLGPRRGHRVQAHKPGGTLFVVVAGVLVVVTVLASLIYLIWQAIPDVPRLKVDRGYAEERRWLPVGREVWQALLRWFRSLRGRGQAAAQRMGASARRRLWGDLPADPVRRLYVQLLRRAAAAGLARPPGTTPLEYERELSKRWPGAEEHFHLLTEAYIERRYGELPVEAQRIAVLQARWHGVRGIVILPPRIRPEAPAPSPALVPSSSGERRRIRLRMPVRRPEVRQPSRGWRIRRRRG